MLSVRAPFGPSEMDLLLGCGVLSPVDSLSGSPTSSLSGLGLVLYNSLAILVSLPCYAWWCYSPRIRLMLWNAYRKVEEPLRDMNWQQGEPLLRVILSLFDDSVLRCIFCIYPAFILCL